jgi:hypothetical protein
MARYHYYRCQNATTHKELCHYRRSYRADRVEEKVWGLISGFLKEPQKLEAGLEEMVRREERSLNRDPRMEVEIWRAKISGAQERRRRCQEMAAEGLIDFGELREMLSELDEEKKVAEREIESLQKKGERLDAMRCNKDALLTNMAEMTPRLIDELAPEEKHRIYGMLGLRVTSDENGSLEAAGELTGLSFGKQEPRCPSRS